MNHAVTVRDVLLAAGAMIGLIVLLGAFLVGAASSFSAAPDHPDERSRPIVGMVIGAAILVFCVAGLVL